MSIEIRKVVLARLEEERERQDRMWGRDHDVENNRAQWLAIILNEVKEVGYKWKTDAQVTRALEKTAAVCIAALELLEETRMVKEDLERLRQFEEKPFPETPGQD
jgi:hypothetical protein